MENINLDNMSYEELVELESRIANKQRDFYIVHNLHICMSYQNKIPYLCYYHKHTRTGGDDTYQDTFTDNFVSTYSNTSLYNYLMENQIPFKYSYTKEELAAFWKPIFEQLVAKKLQDLQKKFNDDYQAIQSVSHDITTMLDELSPPQR